MILLTEEKKIQPVKLFENLNNNHVNLNYIVEVCHEKFLDTKIFFKKTPL